MVGRPRWSRWALVVGVAAGLSAAPVAARPQRPAATPPLSVTVQYGDSLWTLAREYARPDLDVREVVAALMRVNSVSPGRLRPGATLLIPAELLPAERG